MKRYGPYKWQETFSTITVPLPVKKILNIKPGDFLIWEVQGKNVRLRKVVIDYMSPGASPGVEVTQARRRN